VKRRDAGIRMRNFSRAAAGAFYWCPCWIPLRDAMLKRRTFLLGGVGLAGALVVGWSALPPRQRLVGSEALPVRPGEAALNGYVKIAADNTITVLMCRTEMGQGVHTGLAMLVAEELDANWADIRVANAPLDQIY